jgi:hypothetical protein
MIGDAELGQLRGIFGKTRSFKLNFMLKFDSFDFFYFNAILIRDSENAVMIVLSKWNSVPNWCRALE